MSNVVWNAENGWHDGHAATLELDTAGRIVARVLCCWCRAETPATSNIVENDGTRSPACDRHAARWLFAGETLEALS